MMAEKEKKGFMHWYESYQGKKVVGAVYSLGASVVIIGALFKIMHFPGAGAMLMIGMGIEALLFALGCLDKPHTEFHWNNVFPQLVGHGADPEVLEEMKKRPCPTLLGGVGGGAPSGEATPAVPALDAKQLESLKAGVENLAKTAAQLSELGTVATATTGLVSKLDEAGQAAEKFVVAGNTIAEKSAHLGDTYAQVAEGMQKVSEGTKACEAQVNAATASLQQLNAVYELQLNTLQAQVEAYKTQNEKIVAATAQVDALTANVQNMNNVAAEALKSQEAYAAGAKQLANQVADLNKVYGNMLNAL
jgi:gliding motility-associated protein GldL